MKNVAGAINEVAGAVVAVIKGLVVAFVFANHTLSKENCELYYQDVGEVPTHVDASHTADHLRFGDQADKFAYVPDWDHLGTELDNWN